ncbi:SprT family zinc-dependent metalloprotease [Cocleimonas flava]|uniref:YgjP-like metallopeptidase domain-containing protein n=1 Tax=Cocleimonas flava TaxID=634765 RepID=A0A4R1ET95_9GAMM|nr:SprT family zinc-dependent metalloprotease [Cocleimonas flava]TCJ84847.1 hypothetical protein EV695_2810 [Cocleimonas flava]
MKSDTYSLALSDGAHPYLVVRSKRAKHIRIKLSNSGELSLVLPAGTPDSLGHSFIQSKSVWVEKNLSKLSISEKETIPTSLNLRVLNEQWNIDYINPSSTQMSLQEDDDYCLRISGDISDISELHFLINQWCKKKSKKIFTLMLQQLAEEHGFHYNGLSIRAQKTRWGSCSSKKNINLNCKLLFMPVDVVRYVMIHELCHTLEMNHSSRFWDLVEDCDPNYKKHRRELKRLGKEVVL